VFLIGREPVDIRSVWECRARTIALAGLSVGVAIISASLAWPVVYAGLFYPTIVAQRACLFGSAFPIYQTLIVVWLLARMMAYAVRFQMNMLEAISTLSWSITGAAHGVLMLALH